MAAEFWAAFDGLCGCDDVDGGATGGTVVDDDDVDDVVERDPPDGVSSAGTRNGFAISHFSQSFSYKNILSLFITRKMLIFFVNFSLFSVKNTIFFLSIFYVEFHYAMKLFLFSLCHYKTNQAIQWNKFCPLSFLIIFFKCQFFDEIFIILVRKSLIRWNSINSY